MLTGSTAAGYIHHWVTEAQSNTGMIPLRKLFEKVLPIHE